MTIEQAQANMRHGYFGDAAGIAISALAWLAAAIAAFLTNPGVAIAVLFLGGMLIHPGAVLLSKRPILHLRDAVRHDHLLGMRRDPGRRRLCARGARCGRGDHHSDRRPLRSWRCVPFC
jgi:hypothetical protein